MEKQRQIEKIRKSGQLWIGFILLLILIGFGEVAHANWNPPTRYEAENGFNSCSSVSSANSGYSGSGYVTGLNTNCSETKFYKGASSIPLTQMVIRYANGTGANVTNLALYIGSNQKIQDLVFPPTANWSTWSSITVTFNHDGSWGGDFRIASTTNVSASVNIDYSDVSIDDGTATASVATPTFSPGAGTYTSAQSVTISTTTSGATVYYTTDGSTPTTSSAVYSSAINVGSTQTLKALATKSGATNSAIASAAYTINIAPTVATPTFSPGAGTYTSAQSVTISTTTSGATIYYTTDGSTPTASSPVYSGAVSVSASKTLKALATASGLTNSVIGSAAYTINIAPSTVATPTFSPGAGTYTAAQSVTITTTTSGATIYYTTDGSTPTTSSSVYSSAINVGSTQTLKALATASGMTNSAVGSAAYTINTGGGTGTGNITREYWAGISGTAVSNLTSNANYPNSPTSTSLLTSFESPTNVADNYGQRVKGYITAPTTGSYTFWIAADDGAELWLSTDGTTANKVKIASVSGWTNSQEWTKYSTQTSASISLTAGTQYYVEALHKEGAGGDNLAVAWQVPGGTRVVIPGSALSTTLNGGGGTTTVATPTFSPGAGTYTAAQTVTISTTTSGASIRYTTDGTTPTASSTLYSSPITVSATQTVKAIGILSGSTNSAIGSAAYTINTTTPTVATPTFSPGAGTYTSAQTVTISTTTSGASIRYTTDGSAPTASSTLYSSPITVSATQTVKAIGILSGSTNSSVASAAYTINAGGGTSPTGNITRQIWTGIPGTSVSALTNNVNYPNNPTATSVITSFQTTEYGDSYGQRIKGYLVPSVSGSYQFYIAGDDDAELWLSTTEFAANKVKIASYSGWTNALQWDKYGSQASASITLTAGNYYYIEALHKEDNGGDHVEVGWKTPGSSTIDVIPGIVLSTQPGTPLPAPTSFSQTAPASGATGVSRVPSFTWSTSSNTASYTLVVSTSSAYTNPVINQAGITATSYTPSTALSTSTTYYWKVTAVGEGGSTVASNAGISFTTQALPLPGSFSQTSPTGGATGVSVNPAFAWTAALDATSYTLVVSTNSALTSPVINQSGLTGTNYSSPTTLATNTTYYWRASAVNSSGSTVASNANLSFTTSSTANTVYVSTSGVDDGARDGSSGSPWKTLAYAATRVTAGKTIFINAGTYNETQPTILPAGVNISGAGTGSVTLKAGDLGTGGGKEDFTGSLIQLISPSGGAAPVDANQTLSGFTIDGNSKTLKAGIWVQGRNGVIIHHVNIKDCAQRGAVVCYGPGNSAPAYYITGIKIYDMTITNSGVDLSDESTGNLCIAHLDGADVYNITINDIYGYGIKFIFEGYYKNTKIHDNNIEVNEVDAKWSEDICIELWNIGPGNEVYNVYGNTWFSFVNRKDIFNTPAAAGSNLKVHDCRLIDKDGTSIKEGIEVACPGTEIYNCYIQNKGWGIAQWGFAERKVTIRNNIFRNTQAQAVWSDAGAIFITADELVSNGRMMQDIKIYNNVFDNLRTAGGSPLKIVSVWKGTVQNLHVANNVTTNVLPETFDLFLYSGTSVSGAIYENNLKDIAHNIQGNGNTITSSNNIVGTPGYKATGQPWDTYYQPASASSLVVDRGKNVGLPFSGSAPDIGKWELGITSSRIQNAIAEVELGDYALSTYPNPTTGIIKITAKPEIKILGIEVINTQGTTLIRKSANELRSGEIDLSDYNSDVYILRVKHQNGLIIKKVVLVK